LPRQLWFCNCGDSSLASGQVPQSSS
jgi:hypothetical protein